MQSTGCGISWSIRTFPCQDGWRVGIRSESLHWELRVSMRWCVRWFSRLCELQIKVVYSFKRQYSLSNLGLVGYNERYLYCGFFIIWEGCFRKYSTRQRNCIRRTYPWLLLEILLAKHAWLLKGYNEDSRDPKQRYFNTKLCSARVVTKNAYEMLKVIVRILYKKAECRLKKLKYIIMASVMLHNLSSL